MLCIFSFRAKPLKFQYAITVLNDSRSLSFRCAYPLRDFMVLFMRPYPLDGAPHFPNMPFPFHMRPPLQSLVYTLAVLKVVRTLFLHISLLLSILLLYPDLQCEAPKSLLCHYLQWLAQDFLNLSESPCLLFSFQTIPLNLQLF